MYRQEHSPEGVRYLKKFELVETETVLPIQDQVRDPEDLNKFFKDIEDSHVSKVIAVYLNEDFLFLGHQVFLGATAATLETQLVYHYFALFLAKTFILLVNHTSGDAVPTDDDLKLMRSLMVDASALSFKPRFADYIIVGTTKYFSMAIQHGTSRPEEHSHDLKT